MTHGYIVCDLCGHLQAADEPPASCLGPRPLARWTCNICRESDTAWWFPTDKRNAAETHAATITQRYKEGAPA